MIVPERRRPVALDFRLGLSQMPLESTTGLELVHRFENRPRRQDIIVNQDVPHGLEIHRTKRLKERKRLQRGSDHQSSSTHSPTERFDADAIACNQGEALAPVPKDEREHSMQSLHGLGAPLSISFENH